MRSNLDYLLYKLYIMNNHSTLQERINTLISNTYNPTNQEYLFLIQECVHLKEFAATVFVYDHMLSNNITPSNEIYKCIEKLHSKTLPENKTINLPSSKRALQPRRRIHKIIKGYLYKDLYKNALVNVDNVKEYLNNNRSIASITDRIKLAKNISKNCNISFKDARYIVTHLKRTKFLCKFTNQNKITDFFSK